MKAPIFTLPQLFTEEEVSLSDFFGKIVMLTFWVSWCPDCQRDLQQKEDLFKAMNTDNFTLLMINVTGREATNGGGREYYEQMNYSFPCLRDTGTRVYDQYGCISVPTTILLNMDLAIVQRYDDKSIFHDLIKGVSSLL